MVQRVVIAEHAAVAHLSNPLCLPTFRADTTPAPVYQYTDTQPVRLVHRLDAPMNPSWKVVLLTVGMVFILVACGSAEATVGEDPEDPEEEGPAATVSVASYEDFDPGQFEEEVAPETVVSTVEHSVPDRLMEGRADHGVERVVDGFQIQVYSSMERSSAEDVRSDAESWWDDVSDDYEGLFPGGMSINIEFGQPYYRVRLGAFADREEAMEALQVVREKFGDAFLARARVTITR